MLPENGGTASLPSARLVAAPAEVGALGRFTRHARFHTTEQTIASDGLARHRIDWLRGGFSIFAYVGGHGSTAHAGERGDDHCSARLCSADRLDVACRWCAFECLAMASTILAVEQVSHWHGVALV